MENQPTKKRRGLLITFLVLIAIVMGVYLFLPELIGVTAVVGTAFVLLISGIAVFSITMFLLFILTGMGVLVLGIIFTIWTLIAIILFPVLFPIFLPLFLIFLLITLMLRK